MRRRTDIFCISRNVGRLEMLTAFSRRHTISPFCLALPGIMEATFAEHAGPIQAAPAETYHGGQDLHVPARQRVS